MWLSGLALEPKAIAPFRFGIASQKRWKVKHVHNNHKWFYHLANVLTPEVLPELQNMATLLDVVRLRGDTTDSIRLCFSATGEYTTKSAYLLQFEGSTTSNTAPIIWKGWGPGKCRQFLWMASLD